MHAAGLFLCAAEQPSNGTVKPLAVAKIAALSRGNESDFITTQGTMNKITPFLWFDKEAEQAARFYVSVFGNSEILDVARYSKGSPGKPGSVMTVRFRIRGQEFTALNGGPVYKMTPAISFVIHCKTQKELDAYWRKLSAGGKKIQCGWLVDRFGVSWQVVPDILIELLTSRDGITAERVTAAMLKMVKLDIKRLRRAAEKG